MSKEYSQQQLTQFFNQFKKMENSYPIEKVHQIINNPNAMARYKVKHVKPLNFIIMTFLISLTVVLALWFSSPGTNRESAYQQGPSVVVNEPAKTKYIDSPNKLTQETEMETSAIKNRNESNDDTQSTSIEKQHTSASLKGELPLSDEVVDGSKFILELTNDELEKLGFQINHFAVFYRNSFKSRKLFFLAAHTNNLLVGKANGQFYEVKDYYHLQPDTFKIFDTINLTTFLRGSDKTIFDQQFEGYSKNFYPIFNTNQKGEIEKVIDDLDFNAVADTLIPVVVKFSELDLIKKRDQFFWFITNNDFYNSLPSRYSWLKEEFDALKKEKRQKQEKFKIDFKISDWKKEQMIPENVVLDGQNCIVQFTKEELEKIGIFKKENCRWFYCFRTPYCETAGGLLTEFVNGKLETIYDTIVNVDYYAKYFTDCTGDFPFTGTTIKQMDAFFNDDDILLPVQAENKEGAIYWFTLSENFWKLVPERYQYLKKHYETMLYNKSIDPNRNFVTYFKNPFKKVGVDVSIIELSKEELENIGFKYANGGAEINCGFGKNWIQFKFEDMYAKKPVKQRGISIPKTPPYEFVSYIINGTHRFVREEWVGKFDSLYAASNKGYQFVYITDSLGRHIHKIDIAQKDIQINGEDFKYLIPIMVRNSKVANPLSEDRVFWFTPTEAFFERLPDRIKNELRKEYEIVSSEGKNAELSACTYFESCKSTLKVENMKIYPNPAQHEITIDFKLEKPLEGEISIANIAGQEIKILRNKSNFVKGFNSIKCELSGIKPGIYLISLVTNSGYKTERIIVSE